MKEYHPDKCGEMKKKRCERKMKEIDKAYEPIRVFRRIGFGVLENLS
jgi:curved DNA-binding protein CbpA